MIKLVGLFLSLFLASNSFAQVAINGVGVATEAATNPGSFGENLGWGVKKIFNAPIKFSGKVVGACLLSKKVCAGIAAGTISFAYLYEHPEAVESFLERHPDKYDELEKYFNYRKSQTQDTDKLGQYEQAEEDIGLNARTITEQLDLETLDPDFRKYLTALEQASIIIDNAQVMNDYVRNSCSINVAKTLVDLTPSEFNKTINIYLPKENVGPEVLWSFDAHNNMKSKDRVMESDHSPSYKALEILFNNYHVSFVGKKKTGSRYNNLVANATAILIPYSTHKANRTYGPKNKILASQDGANSATLRNAFLKDFATILWIEKSNSPNMVELVRIFPQVYIRNKMLCLYDLDRNVAQGLTLQKITNNLIKFDYKKLLTQI